MISRYLSREERLGLMRIGAVAKAAEYDAAEAAESADSSCVLSEKRADGWLKDVTGAVTGGVSAANHAAILMAILGGIPIGVAAHLVDRRITGHRAKEDEVKSKIRAYQDAADELSSGLGA